MNFVDEEHLVQANIAEDAGEIEFLLQDPLDVVVKGTPSSSAMMEASGLAEFRRSYSRTWSMASPRLRAASIAIDRFSLSLLRPVKSA